jgi:hypothetical protein
MISWVDFCYEPVRRGVKVFGYDNKHYAAHALAQLDSSVIFGYAKDLPELWS